MTDTLKGHDYINAVNSAEIAEHMGIKPSTLRRFRSAVRGDANAFPAPDYHTGQIPLWDADKVQQWIDAQPTRQKKEGPAS